jgi:hypothetical protein
MTLWWAMRCPVANLIVEMKAQMPTNPEVEKSTPGTESLGSKILHSSDE